MIVKDVADHIKHLYKKFPIHASIVDPASKQVVMELINRYGLPLIAAEKSDKQKHIELLNSDLITGTIKILNSCTQLIEEITTLVWNEDKRKAGKWEEHSACPNHLCDAMLYGWRYCHQYLWTPEDDPVTVDSEMDRYWQEESERMLGDYETDNYLGDDFERAN
jgi:phage terminase large subunit